MTRTHGMGNGPILVGWTALTVGVMLAIVAASAGLEAPGLRLAIRATARTSFLLYGLAFLAAPLQVLSPGRLSRYLLRNRRYLGLSFGTSHLYHLGAILLLVAQSGSRRLGGLAAFLPGGFLYFWIFLMMATSSDRAVAWLGAKRWKLLHRTGMVLIFVGFLKGFGLPLAEDPLTYGPLFALLVGLLALKGAAWLAARRQAGPAAAGS